MRGKWFNLARKQKSVTLSPETWSLLKKLSELESRSMPKEVDHLVRSKFIQVHGGVPN